MRWRHCLVAFVLAVPRLAGAQIAATLALSPAYPSSADAIDIALESCLPETTAVSRPAVSGSTVALVLATTPAPCALDSTTATRRHFTIAPLPAGSYTVQLEQGDQVFAATGLDVQAEPSSLFLLDRFHVEAFWTGPDGIEHPAGAARVSEESGTFWFFSDDNAELTLKLLDGRPVNGHFWVFIGALTNVAWRVHVVDRGIACVAAPCGEKDYRASTGMPHNVIDLGAY
jgi:hypothetical protein